MRGRDEDSDTGGRGRVYIIIRRAGDCLGQANVFWPRAIGRAVNDIKCSDRLQSDSGGAAPDGHFALLGDWRGEGRGGGGGGRSEQTQRQTR